MKRVGLVLLTVAAGVFALHAMLTVWRQNERAAGLDFYIYFVNAQLASRDDIANIYEAEVQERVGEEYFARAQAGSSELRKYDAGRRRRLDNVSSPFLYTSLSWVSREYDAALRQYHVAVLAAFVLGVLLLARRAELRLWLAFTLLGVLLHVYRAFEADLRVGNVNALQLAAVGLMLVLPAPSVLAGILLAFKPNVLGVVILLLASRVLTRDWARLRRELAGGLAGGTIAFAIASLHYGTPRVWVQWMSAANQFWHRLPQRLERNVAPALPWFSEYGTWVSYVLAAILIVIVCMAVVRAKRVDELLLVAAGLLVYLLSATVVWLHYLVLAIPAIVALLRWRATAIVAVLALLAMAEEPIEWLGIPAFPIESWLVTPSLVALFVCVVWKIATTELLPGSDRDPAAAASR
jgi:hypothetical protein